MDTPRIKKLSDIKGLESFLHYGVDTEGNVYSWKNKKPRILRPGWAKRRGGYLFVRLSDINGNKKNMFVHRLVCMAYLPCGDFTLEVNHLNRNQQDNRLENLQWITPNENKKYNKEVKGFVLDDYITTKIKEVHIASIRKGLPVPDGYSFLNSILEGALENHINQYGLRKVMNPIPSPKY
jgi:hypothetical protein